MGKSEGIYGVVGPVDQWIKVCSVGQRWWWWWVGGLSVGYTGGSVDGQGRTDRSRPLYLYHACILPPPTCTTYMTQGRIGRSGPIYTCVPHHSTT